MTNCGFAQISNAVLLDERISFKARGILALLLSRPANWRIYINEISERSTKEGKKAIQSGFKELVDYGYLQLISFVNKETGRFEGKGYVICKKTKTHRQRPFSTVLKTDHPITGSSPKRIDLKEDRPQMVSYNNTEGSNTKKQQHQKRGIHKTDDVEFEKIKKDITTFYTTLQNDTEWQTLYTSTAISAKRILLFEELYLLFLHFKSTSLKSGTIYANLSEVKKHFANWFQANLSKKSILQFIRDGKKEEQKARVFLFPLITKVNFYFDTLLKRQCASVEQVNEFKAQLITASEKLSLKQPLLSKAKERESICTLQSDITKILSKLNSAAAKGQLEWFCHKPASTGQ